ncbi:Crp/Fnr family transcriptional regulator [Myroides guanonis]|uniref:cAMP-binding domain of CRP or a regulatory subunit of cAMP-dependent protein kinases n=1 Tax=Myroides guanonis TaxID=1150112 RepID=A0A1I3R477_9FLAO|nr:Crp/Fnr family transcriptional regulator [Myroides guanonis]SFJ40241.1 cAMP-binding domain of CRP or a regulatory subunit of cAMP-dependent protein kinases [Myroides guanonis]
MIDLNLLLEFGGEHRKVKKNELIFEEGTFPAFYYQIVEGEVKMNNFTEDGKEFIQNIFTQGQSFGEPPLFIDEPYPANAVAITPSVLMQIPKNAFYSLLNQYPEVSFAINKSLARRLYYKSVMAPEISSQDPEKRLLTLMDYLKSHYNEDLKEEYIIPMTRQQLADLTGLRVETVIRTIKHLERRGELKIIQRKIYR